MRSCKPVLFLLLGVAVLLSACQPSEPIQIGFVSELSGRNAVLGVQSRNGAQMAVDELNAGKGINGQPLEMLVYDDGGKKDSLLAADQALIDQGVVAITGHTTSWETIEALDLLANSNMILFSPTTSTPVLSGKADLFFRLIPSNISQANPLAHYLYSDLSHTRASIIFELDNKNFTQTYTEAFEQHYAGLGGKIVTRLGYSSSRSPDFAALVSQVRSAGQADALVVVASSVETALIAQHARLQNWDVQIASSNWSYTDDLIQNGGRSIDGILITSQFNSDCQEPAYLAFKNTFQEHYGEPPAFSAVFSYETILVLARALELTGGQRQGLEDAIVQAGQLQGLCDQIVMDKYGDVQRTLYLITVHDGKFEILKEYAPD